jgi:hypothetical protein
MKAGKWHGGKGSASRVSDNQLYKDNYDRIFRKGNDVKTYYEQTCDVTSTRTEKTVQAECDNVKEKVSFDAWIANSRIKMYWNGKTYVGNMSGMEFTSDGPRTL